jgi:hypothetical protein
MHSRTFINPKWEKCIRDEADIRSGGFRIKAREREREREKERRREERRRRGDIIKLSLCGD